MKNVADSLRGSAAECLGLADKMDIATWEVEGEVWEQQHPVPVDEREVNILFSTKTRALPNYALTS